jgi:hypothetical protein
MGRSSGESADLIRKGDKKRESEKDISTDVVREETKKVTETAYLLRESGCQAFKHTQVPFVKSKQERSDPLERGARQTL